jgi:hypothetical protein
MTLVPRVRVMYGDAYFDEGLLTGEFILDNIKYTRAPRQFSVLLE